MPLRASLNLRLASLQIANPRWIPPPHVLQYGRMMTAGVPETVCCILVLRSDFEVLATGCWVESALPAGGAI